MFSELRITQERQEGNRGRENKREKRFDLKSEYILPLLPAAEELFKRNSVKNC